MVLRAMATRADDRFPSVHALGRALLNLASPKGRVLWSDYFSRALGPAGSNTARSGWQPWAQPAAGPPTVFSARGTPSDVRPVSVIRTNELTRRQGSRWWLAGLGVVGIGLAAAAYMNFGPPRSLIESAKQGAPTPEMVAKGTAALAPAAPPRTAPPAVDDSPRPADPRPEPPAAEPIDPAEARKPGTARPVGARARSSMPAATPGPRAKRSAVRRAEAPDLIPPGRKQRQPNDPDQPLPPPKPLQGPTGAPILD